jgi:hypothetical protein
MRFLTGMSTVEKAICFVAIFVAFVCVSSFYTPSLSYCAYKIGGGSVKLTGGFSVKMADGWYPVYLKGDASGSYVLFVKINPWFPNRERVSTLDMVDKVQKIRTPPTSLSNNVRIKVERFIWGEVFFLGDFKTAFVSNSGLSINFDNRNDLNDILELKKR